MEYRLQLDSQNDIERAIKSPPRRTVEKPEEEIDKEVVQGEEDVKNVEIDKDVKEIFQPEKRNDTECNRRDEAVVEKEKIIEQVFNTINTEREIIRSNLSTINQAEPTLLNTTESPSAQERTTLLQNVFNDVFRYHRGVFYTPFRAPFIISKKERPPEGHFLFWWTVRGSPTG